MARSLKLHPGPDDVVERAVQVLSEWVPTDALVLGGGTALEARWHHRESTDLDFFGLHEHLDEMFYGGADYVREGLERHARAGVVDRREVTIIRDTVLHFHIAGTPVSVGRVARFEQDEFDDRELRTGVRLAAPVDILTKKLHHRTADSLHPTRRDSYDYLLAQLMAPTALRRAWNGLSMAEKDRIKQMYAAAAELGVPTSAEPDRDELKLPSHPALADDLWSQAARLFDSNLAYVPLGSESGEPDNGRN